MTDLPTLYDYDPNNLPLEYLQAIGLAIASASQTENILSIAVAGCLGVTNLYGLALTPHMAIPLKMSVLKSAAAFRLNADLLKELNSILDEVQTALGHRNKYAHDGWCTHPKTGAVLREVHTARTKVELELVPTTVDKIKEKAAIIYGAGLKLMTFLFTNNLMPEPQKPLLQM